jgi:hypothetical protein
VALEKMDGVAGVFVDNGITILLAEDKPLDEAAVRTSLEPLKIKITGVKKAEKLPL